MSWEKFGLDLEENYRENIRKFWHITEGLRDKMAKPIRNVEDDSSTIMMEDKDILEEWRKYYREKFSMDVVQGSRNT